ncbi:hypothetical protein [Paenibacillus chitinolyticus]|uniref:hypothetical protein n=1 Tax=Paenibacillus chitinolyticus TaxID=79263 RepID=UPI001C47588D|nr:hypothetical protein [Paenibacillus chitinolyticus]MBV6717221.1 hypothetical protein [Paenibacillus chitinolyticus]
MSMNTTFKTWDELLEYLKTQDGKCFNVNYLPKEDEFEIWIGWKPFYNYEKLIELEQDEKNKLRAENEKLKEQLEKAGLLNQ